jgi:hypothetical protein
LFSKFKAILIIVLSKLTLAIYGREGNRWNEGIIGKRQIMSYKATKFIGFLGMCK